MGSDSVNDIARLIENKRQEAGIVDQQEPPNVFDRVRQTILASQPDEVRPSKAEQAERERRYRINEQGFGLERAAGERYKDCRLSTFKVTTDYQRKVIEAIREYGHSIDERLQDREGMVLYGPVGTGKDHLAYALAVQCVVSGKTVGWVNGQNWFGSIRDAMDSHRSEASIIREIAKPDVAFISDPLPPVGDLSQHQSTMFYRAIESRYAEGKITITTVNVADDSEGDRRMGAATWDRLCHNAWKIHCRWKSYRAPSREIKPVK
jgi:DNA replication protein DnaC